MNLFVIFSGLIRLILLPILLPLSIFYGAIAWLVRILKSIQQVQLSSPVVSVGNFSVGGSGKTPIVQELVKILESKNLTPIVISKSYKASLKDPMEVGIEDSPLEVGDEALLLKTLFPHVHVFSGPIKFKTALYADKKLKNFPDKVFILDDGAQHYKIKKNYRINVWDMSKNWWTWFPFPLGWSREFWFLGEKAQLNILNRFKNHPLQKIMRRFICGPKIAGQYQVESIKNFDRGHELQKDFVLISGIGNFNQLKSEVKSYIHKSKIEMLEAIEGRDHDDFSWFKAGDGINYVCTEKDVAKLRSKLSLDQLYVVRSGFSKEFQEKLTQTISKFCESLPKLKSKSFSEEV